MRFAVVGGGISGLAAAWTLSARSGTRVTVFEPGPVGGKLQTSEFAGRPVDEGPDAFLIRTPEATKLCAEIGLDDLVPPAAGRTLLWSGGRLSPLPEGLVLGVPGRLGPLLRSGLLSPAGLARAGLDLVLPRSPVGPDVSVEALVAGRFGHQVADRLVEPLLGSIHAAPLGELSTAVVAPNILAAARSSRSLLLGMRRALAGAPQAAGPIFLAPRPGMASLAHGLEKALRDRGVEFLGRQVTAVSPEGAGVTVATAGRQEPFAGAVLAVPAPVAAGLLGAAAPAGLRDIEFTSVAVLTVAVDRARWQPPAGFNGLLVAGRPRPLMTACSFYTNKWPGAAGPADPAVIRVSAGRYDDRRVEQLDDGELTRTLLGELGRAVGADIRPTATRLSRWPSSFPLYRVGHAEVVERIEQDLRAASAGRVSVAGASYGGAGIPACIRSGRRAADSVHAGAGGGPPGGAG